MDNTDYITPVQVKEGLKKCYSIVHRLLSDAELAFKNGRYSTSVSAAIIAFEEVSKANYLRKKFIEGKGLSREEWDKLSSGGGAHKVKLTSMMDFKEKLLDTISQDEMNFINSINEKLGYPPYADIKTQKKYTKILKNILPKLNLLKQDCFYLNWNEKNKKWTYFDMRYDDKIKKTIAYFLLIESKHDLLVQKVGLQMPQKPFIRYTEEDWNRIKNSNDHTELQKILKEIYTPKFQQIAQMVFSLVDNY